ncbi:hypothetical protein M0D68_06965 [Paraburkholderia sp. SEWSISQ10-3 4]|uniref:hypothetical protein n=1 Tax=Paraburkholderia TaxID=1822464 RepID=UPI00224D4F49|nr:MULTISPECIES: hypothetical protein [Paraburkholderia]MCX4137918.1 hypothetical protein [Paraburkholderia aspalathi]MDN7170609.1 hypothetical protein [Paraburkholderia sp. SEWSISQ10-3 4]MDQ6500248.1 hypothetical protein [Paraburkholderia aspalathi]
MASVNKVMFVGRLASAATTFRSASQWKVYSQPVVAEKFKEPINATTVIKVELVCDEESRACCAACWTGSAALRAYPSWILRRTNAEKRKPCCCRQSVLS